MLETTDPEREVTAGIDTHADTHTVAALDELGRLLGHATFAATSLGYEQLLGWLTIHGRVVAVGVEGTGSYGAGIARHLNGHGFRIIEVDRPDRRMRRHHGKSDPVDAVAAARAVQAGTATGTPKSRDGVVESIRALRVARHGAIKAHTAAINALRQTIITGPTDLREQLTGLGPKTLVATCARLRPGDLTQPAQGVKAALRRLARRCQMLAEEIADADRDLSQLIAKTAPDLLAQHGVGPEIAGQLLITAGDNPTRLRSEASFAALCGASPLPASSGKTNRHRLNRGGDRAANSALHRVVIMRMKSHNATRAYVARRTEQGMSKRDIIRCLKRYVARELLPHIKAAAQKDSDPKLPSIAA
ncbi:MAG TPA: IS110 family transposase [Actinomycetes bacterium]|nr:IS110 family transposase [Actinomycetes bacterium]